MPFHKKNLRVLFLSEYLLLHTSICACLQIFPTDDSIMFTQASIKECEAILDVLHQYELASGQKVNVDKSAILFSSNTPNGFA